MKKFFNSNKKRLPGYTSLSREKNEEFEEDNKLETQFTSSQSRFQLKKLGKQFKEFHQAKHTDYKETLDASFKLSFNIKNHIKKPESKLIYAEAQPEKKFFDKRSDDYGMMQRITWPDFMQKENALKPGTSLYDTTYKKERGENEKKLGGGRFGKFREKEFFISIDLYSQAFN